MSGSGVLSIWTLRESRLSHLRDNFFEEQSHLNKFCGRFKARDDIVLREKLSSRCNKRCNGDFRNSRGNKNRCLAGNWSARPELRRDVFARRFRWSLFSLFFLSFAAISAVNLRRHVRRRGARFVVRLAQLVSPMSDGS